MDNVSAQGSKGNIMLALEFMLILTPSVRQEEIGLGRS